jgi:hypothetical protein
VCHVDGNHLFYEFSDVDYRTFGFLGGEGNFVFAILTGFRTRYSPREDKGSFGVDDPGKSDLRVVVYFCFYAGARGDSATADRSESLYRLDSKRGIDLQSLPSYVGLE